MAYPEVDLVEAAEEAVRRWRRGRVGEAVAADEDAALGAQQHVGHGGCVVDRTGEFTARRSCRYVGRCSRDARAADGYKGVVAWRGAKRTGSSEMIHPAMEACSGGGTTRAEMVGAKIGS